MNFSIDELILLIRVRLSFGQSLEEIHDFLVVKKKASEENFYLCYQAALLA